MGSETFTTLDGWGGGRSMIHSVSITRGKDASDGVTADKQRSDLSRPIEAKLARLNTETP